MDAIADTQTTIFSGLGNLGGEYTIKLKPDVKPYSLFTPRHVPLPLHPEVKIEKMESMGVISRVDEPTELCAGMVVVADEILAQVFSKLDANSGFWIPLAKSSRLLTTFIAPFGHLCSNKLLFGI